ncbi:DUF2399 domain-containing protein [Bacillus sp. Marseille-P3661]|uniref:DUF2399 domain-containing protein n=1 Tax=Bacillus sp. Marseille-P3661 TaxID=1936234 RepID=UPI0015E19AE9|nr:DUF2399 domain-containing protein [Bacillus sp. Marseille-P3661]
MNTSLLAYLENNILKKGEELELPHLFNEQPNSIIDIRIIKRLETRIKLVGLISCSTENFDEEDLMAPDDQLLKLTIKKKLHVNDISETLALPWTDEGWLVKELRFMKDSRTVDRVFYRMGYKLYCYQRKLQQQNVKNIEDAVAEWKKSTADILSKKTRISFINLNKELKAPLIDYLSTILRKEHDVMNDLPHIPEKWPIKKKLKFLHFLTALVQLTRLKAEFDWKEIGAQYYQEIGGSKEFDSYKDEFIAQLEEIIQNPVATLGLISLGKITPLYFSGQLTGTYSEYKYGPVHALTDLAISQENYQSSAETLWLVENRAILTRISAEAHFLKENQALIVCVDGHLRSSHRQCLLQFTKNSGFKQVIIWTDYDQDGLQIASELTQAISEHYRGNVKWITHDLQVVKTWEDYESNMNHFLRTKKMEQEQILGSVADWKKWIQLQ